MSSEKGAKGNAETGKGQAFTITSDPWDAKKGGKVPLIRQSTEGKF